ncbi:hypothetical protein BU26DRAFT_130620 [Trematosphaeria pertusa]|uniref:Uncharacterized protein n=1 Tax=Trematosphaeria pertusa TaxID=390896 RepID=A0A6A6HWV8_9PLEO|nr:uncharacterized protein BU26DRAFT_130620 [Trematosphaeria pertusa]KAF2242694.1 hypothetical protein BU26DRAFT_130620 [Trematosphaeria pertusa]
MECMESISMCILKGYVRREGGRSSEDSGDLERPNARNPRWLAPSLHSSGSSLDSQYTVLCHEPCSHSHSGSGSADGSRPAPIPAQIPPKGNHPNSNTTPACCERNSMMLSSEKACRFLRQRLETSRNQRALLSALRRLAPASDRPRRCSTADPPPPYPAYLH